MGENVGFSGHERILDLIDSSIRSAIEWGSKTNEDLSICTKRVEHLQRLQDIVVTLSWRYGKGAALFKITQETMPEGSISVKEIIDDADDFWTQRVWIDENEKFSRVYINL